MKCTLDHTRTVFIHDHDGVHYRYLDNPDYIDFLSETKAIAASRILAGLDVAEASRINTEFYYACGDGSRGFYEMAVAQGISVEDFRLRLHLEYHRVAYERVQVEHPHWIRACGETQGFMTGLKGVIRHGLLTQASVDIWAKPNLQKMGILEHFEVLLGYEEAGFEMKSESTRPIEMALEAMNATPEQSVFIEDSPKNLRKAKERFPSLCTVYICDDKPLDIIPHYIDIQVDSFKRLKQAVTRVQFPEAMKPSPAL